MRVLLIAGFGPIAADPAAARAFYVEGLGLALHADGDYLHTGDLAGTKHFAVWPLADAAQSCFGQGAWPDGVPRPQAWIEFDVDDLAAATAELQAKGYRLLAANREEPWGQGVTRLLGPEGLLVGLTVTPWLRQPGGS